MQSRKVKEGIVSEPFQFRFDLTEGVSLQQSRALVNLLVALLPFLYLNTEYPCSGCMCPIKHQV